MSVKKVIGLLLPPEGFLFSSHTSNYYYTEILRGILAVSNLFEYYVLVHHSVPHSSEDYEIALFDNEEVQGVLMLAPIINKENQKNIKLINMPVVVVNARYDSMNYVDVNNYDGAKEAVNHLISIGHKRIGVINGLIDTTNAVDRFDGYKDALKENNIELDDKLVKYGNFFEDTGYNEMNNIFDLHKEEWPTAVFCGNDLMAYGALKAIKEKKLKVPRDISIIGFNDNVISEHLNPKLTTVRQQLFHLGKEAMTILTSIINKESPGLQQVELKTRLILRESTAAPKGSGE